MIIFFRGKAATGKTTLSNMIQVKMGFHVISKDSIFDVLLSQGLTWDEANAMAYDKLAEAVQYYHDNEENVLVDIGLAHTPYYKNFLSKMTMRPECIKSFLFTCTSDDVWEKRMMSRIASPETPNQIFKSIEEARGHYAKYTISLLEGEVEVDSAMPLDSMFLEVLDAVFGPKYSNNWPLNEN